MKARDTAMLLGLAALVAVPITAQTPRTPISLEVHAGMGVPVGDMEHLLSPGVGLGITMAYRVSPMVDLYVGYSRQSFGKSVSTYGMGGEGETSGSDAGFSAGGRLHVPVMPSIRPWISAGVTANQLTQNSTWYHYADGRREEQDPMEYDYSLGFEARAGLALPVATQIFLTPAVGFQRYEPKYGSQITEDRLGYITFRLGGRICL